MYIKTNMEETTSFNQLYKDYQTSFVNFAYTYVRDWNVAEDITAEAIIYYWENRNSLSGVANIPAYILTAINIGASIISGIYGYMKNVLKQSKNIMNGNSMHASFHWRLVNPMNCLPKRYRNLFGKLWMNYRNVPARYL